MAAPARSDAGIGMSAREWRGPRFSSRRSSRGRGRGRFLEVFSTRISTSPYDEGKEGKEGKDTSKCHRVAQAWEIGGMMRRGVERGSLVGF